MTASLGVFFRRKVLLSVMINVMFFLGFPPVAQYVAQGLIIVGAVAVPELLGAWRARR